MRKVLLLAMLFVIVPLVSAYGAYHHGGDTDSDKALQAYPAIEGTKLDSCALCHTGGQYEKKPGVLVSLGSCQWCHYSYGYDGSGNIEDTINSYGASYMANGKSLESFAAIAEQDSDGDGYANQEEITTLRYPGNPDDDPTKVAAPFRVINSDELEAMPLHSQVMLLNTHKSGDFYTEYSGVPIADLLDDSGVLASATGITVYAPDGWAQYHPLEPDDDPLMYHVYGMYPQADFFYNEEADEALSEVGWCDYSSPAIMELAPEEPIDVMDGLKMILAYARDDEYLEVGKLTNENKLDGEGPFRVVPPQKIVGPPDQSVKSVNQDVTWPFDETADHNAGYATRSATIIKVEPLPQGTTDVEILEAGWNYVDEGKILIYGAIDPLDTVLAKMVGLISNIREMDRENFKIYSTKRILIGRLSHMQRKLRRGHEQRVVSQLERLLWKLDGCNNAGTADRNDWIIDCSAQPSVYWALNEIKVLLEIEN